MVYGDRYEYDNPQFTFLVDRTRRRLQLANSPSVQVLFCNFVYNIYIFAKLKATSRNTAWCGMKLLRKQLTLLDDGLSTLIFLFEWLCHACSGYLSWKSNFPPWVVHHCIELLLAEGTWGCIYLCKTAERYTCSLKWPLPESVAFEYRDWNIIKISQSIGRMHIFIFYSLSQNFVQGQVIFCLFVIILYLDSPPTGHL